MCIIARYLSSHWCEPDDASDASSSLVGRDRKQNSETIVNIHDVHYTQDSYVCSVERVHELNANIVLFQALCSSGPGSPR